MTAISAADFSIGMTPFGPRPLIAAAVSGGGDSMAMVLLLNDWAKQNNSRLIAFTVDHALRPGSRGEAERAGEILHANGIPHEILTWHGEKPCTGIQQHARAARYELLAAACAKNNCATLALAHNLEDQAETFWMRLAHGSGLDGLAGMAAERKVDILSIIRPVLSFTRARLRATCMARGVQWIDDPSNENEKFLRVRLRQFEDMLGAEGLTPDRLARTMRKLSQAREALDFFTAQALSACITFENGEAVLKIEAWRAQPSEIQSRVLSATLQAVNPQDYAPGADQLEALRAALQSETFTGRTLGGCTLSKRSKGIVIRREVQDYDIKDVSLR